MEGLLQGVKSFSKAQLSETTTRVRHRDGRLYEEQVHKGVLKNLGSEPIPSFLSDMDKGFSHLAPFVFKHDAWVRCDEKEAHKPQSIGMECRDISVVTYNVWFKEWHMETRAKAMFTLLEKERPDVICLQEVTEPFLKLLIQHPFFQAYYLSDAIGRTCYPYGVLMAVSKNRVAQIPVFTLHALPSNMGRRFLRASLQLTFGSIFIGTAHLESLKNQLIRKEQISVIKPLLLDEEHLGSFWMGDFNFGDHAPEARELQPFVDAWHASQNTEKQITCQDDGRRIDKVLFLQTGTMTISPRNFNLIGTSPVPEISHPPSDHFGLTVGFLFKN